MQVSRKQINVFEQLHLRVNVVNVARNDPLKVFTMSRDSSHHSSTSGFWENANILYICKCNHMYVVIWAYLCFIYLNSNMFSVYLVLRIEADITKILYLKEYKKHYKKV